MEQSAFANIASPKGFILKQCLAIPATVALAAGICTARMAFMGNTPIALPNSE